MPVRVLCRNPNCSASYSAIDAGQFESCPSCGWKLSPVDEFDSGGLRETRTEDYLKVPDPPPINDPLLGTTFAGRYQIAKRIGKGGMGAVYLARDTMLERDVALKIPLVEVDEGSECLKRFMREARSAAKLQHPNICPVHDVGSSNGQPYLTMAYIDGVSLADHLKERKKPFDPVKAARLVRSLALALQKAHESGVIHRDLKPGNVMISKEGRPTIMDFGLARRDDVNESLKTRTGQMMGTPAYMPIEQFRGDVHAMGPRSDVYSLGVILFQLLTGRVPFVGAPMSVMAQLLQSEIPLASSLRAELDPELVALCRKAMGKEIDDRFASMKDFAAAIDAYLAKLTATTAGEVPASPEVRTKAESAESKQPAAAPDREPVEKGNRFAASLIPHAAASGRRLQPAIAKGAREHWFWAAPAIFGAILFLGVIIYVVTDTGTVKITGTDPNMTVRIDNREILVENLGPPIRIRAGTHDLLVTRHDPQSGNDLVVRSDKFVIKRGEETPLKVEYILPAEPTKPPPIEVAQGDGAKHKAADAAPPEKEKPDLSAETKIANARPNEPKEATKPNDSPKNAPAPVAFVGIKAGDTKTLKLRSLDLVLRWCPPGKFTMGSPKSEEDRGKDEDQVEVELTKGFWMLETEVTQELYEQVAGANPSNFKSPRNPVETVSYNEAVGFTTKLTEQLHNAGALPADWQIKLPTEAQWEYACRAGTKTVFAFGDRLSSKQANFNGNYPYGGAAKGPYLQKTVAVGQYPANAWGLYDMHGNVWEWCLDGYREQLLGGVDPFSPTAGAFGRVFRGGSWGYRAALARSALRGRNAPEDRYYYLGFRLAAVQEGPGK